MTHSQAFLDLVNETRPRVREVSVQETRDLLKKDPQVHFLDIREDNEWANGHAAGAMHIGKGVIERDIETAVPDKNAEIILYCGGGFRSILAADALKKMGYANVASMAGGWREWRDSGAPTETP
jgi:rhodanese-related sulfurtransferase